MGSDDANRPKDAAGREGDLPDRLQQLGARLDRLPVEAGSQGGARTPDAPEPNVLARAMRLSTEFVAGVIAGFAVGWLVDTLAGTRPFGMIVCVMLGLAAGLMNAMRAAGLLRSAPLGMKQDAQGRPAARDD